MNIKDNLKRETENNHEAMPLNLYFSLRYELWVKIGYFWVYIASFRRKFLRGIEVYLGV